MRFKDKGFFLRLLFVLFLSNILAWLVVYDLSRSRFLEVNFFDVGQGDAIFIETPDSRQILIDGGPGSAVLEKLGKAMPFWDRTIDLVILSHPESDHLSGLLEVLKRYKVENILWTGVKRNTAEYAEWLRLIEKESSNVFIVQAGKEATASGIVFEVLFPLESQEGKEFKDSNNSSIVAKLTFGDTAFLLTGDVYKSAEEELIRREIALDSDVLKISHHGSKTSTSEEFIKNVSPDIAVISAAKDNSYGHPHQDVLETLEKYGINILRTDLDGDIKIFSDGKNLKINN